MKAAILGYGNVGKGACDIIAQSNTGLEVKRILARRMRPGMEDIITLDFNDILNDPEIEIVCEAIGGLSPAYQYVSAALKAGKHVVSANKELISHYYAELNALARENGVCLRFAPSSGGGIPWLPNLIRAKRCDSIEEISCILNGTTNYILYNMTEKSLSFETALKGAQDAGYAEADPSADIDGEDTRRKCAISASIAFDVALDENSVDVFGIRHITAGDIAAFKEMGKVCKLMVKAGVKDEKIYAYVEPTLLSSSSLESAVPLNYNIGSLVGRSIGKLSFYGQGAGSLPTGSSMVQDMIDIKEGISGAPAPRSTAKADNSAESHRYYIRTSASVKGLRSISDGDSKFYITDEEYTVAEMHEMAAEIRKSDPNAFFAGICG